jgi:D-alanyl-D-alanine carboxypeptidase
MDSEGRIVFAKNAEDEHAPASLVKMMSLYLAYEDIERGRARLEDLVYISRHAWSRPAIAWVCAWVTRSRCAS